MSKLNEGILQSPSSTAHVAYSCLVTPGLPSALAGLLVRLCRGQDWAHRLCESQPAVKKLVLIRISLWILLFLECRRGGQKLRGTSSFL